MDPRHLFLVALFFNALILSIEGKGCEKQKNLNESQACLEPDFLTEDQWLHAVSRQAHSIVYPENFEQAYNTSLGTVIRTKQREDIACIDKDKCKNDKKKARRKRNKNLRLPDPLPKELLLEHALCEWETVENEDINRKPRILIENKCRCRYTKYLKKNYLCEPLTMYMRVLRRVGCVEGVWRYTQVWEPFSVGCMAVKLPSTNKLQARRKPVSKS